MAGRDYIKKCGLFLFYIRSARSENPAGLQRSWRKNDSIRNIKKNQAKSDRLTYYVYLYDFHGLRSVIYTHSKTKDEKATLLSDPGADDFSHLVQKKI
jgi:hypothetical protein